MEKGTYNPVPFAEGRSRTAHKGKLTAPPESSGREIVVKKPRNASYASLLGGLEADVEVARKAQEFAESFNLVSRTATPINFQLPVKRTVVATGEPIVVEYYLYGEYTKWISNNGWINHGKIGGNDLLLAFAHWTWVKSGGQHLVCDLQGVKGDPDGYHLTDPVIHSPKQEYGTTDLGKRGVDLFFKTHVCNSECLSLGILNDKPKPSTPNLQALLSLIGNQLGTSYRGELPLLLPQILDQQTYRRELPSRQSRLQRLHDSANPYQRVTPSGILLGMKATYRY